MCCVHPEMCPVSSNFKPSGDDIYMAGTVADQPIGEDLHISDPRKRKQFY